MEAETYPDEGVQGYIKGNPVWVEFNALEQPEVAERFECCWTPTILFEDAEGREPGRSEGYLDPKRFIGQASLAWLKDALDRRGLEEFATEHSREALERTGATPRASRKPSTDPASPHTG
jgi:thioredoxin-related protein